MHPDISTLQLFSAGLTVVVVGVLLLFSMTQRIYRGFGWWLSAQSLLAVATLLQAAALDIAITSAVVPLLLLQWPVLVLTGVRRFDARQSLLWPLWLDVMALAVAYVACCTAHLLIGTSAARLGVMALSAAALHAWVAIQLLHGARSHHGPTLRGLTLFITLLAGAHFSAALYALLETGNVAVAAKLDSGSSLIAAMTSLVMSYFALLMSSERTERELRDSRRRLRFLANIDMLTRVPNRRHFQELARRALERGAPGSAAVLIFDIDHFKRINDLLGHAAGDRALRLVSRCAQETLRTQDVAGRHGGDEFVLLLPDTTVEDALVVAARIVARVQTHTDHHGIPQLSLSFGVVQSRAGESVDEALRRADQALYEAKRQGRSRAVIASGDEAQPVYGASRPLGLTSL
jgi:diguanylate cyclase (GGDEF)-like protein